MITKVVSLCRPPLWSHHQFRPRSSSVPAPLSVSLPFTLQNLHPPKALPKPQIPNPHLISHPPSSSFSHQPSNCWEKVIRLSPPLTLHSFRLFILPPSSLFAFLPFSGVSARVGFPRTFVSQSRALPHLDLPTHLFYRKRIFSNTNAS